MTSKNMAAPSKEKDTDGFEYGPTDPVVQGLCIGDIPGLIDALQIAAENSRALEGDVPPPEGKSGKCMQAELERTEVAAGQWLAFLRQTSSR